MGSWWREGRDVHQMAVAAEGARAEGAPFAGRVARLIAELGRLRGRERRARLARAQLRAVFDAAPVGIALLDGKLRYISVNRRLAEINGLPAKAHIGRGLRDVLPAPLADRLGPIHRRVLESGEAIRNLPIAGETAAEPGRARHWLVSCERMRDPRDGRTFGVCYAVLDVTEQTEAERLHALVAQEAAHRANNAMMNVLAVAEQTLRRLGDDPQRFVRDFTGRLRVLARAHRLLTTGTRADGRADLAEVVRAALAPWLSGGAIGLPPPEPAVGPAVGAAEAQALALALHELATNAMKHGALSRPGGRVRVAWEVGADGAVTFAWAETGGPRAEPPPVERQGFGSRLLGQALPRQLGDGASVQLTFEPAGFRACVRIVPVARRGSGP